MRRRSYQDLFGCGRGERILFWCWRGALLFTHLWLRPLRGQYRFYSRGTVSLCIRLAHSAFALASRIGVARLRKSLLMRNERRQRKVHTYSPIHLARALRGTSIVVGIDRHHLSTANRSDASEGGARGGAELACRAIQMPS